MTHETPEQPQQWGQSGSGQPQPPYGQQSGGGFAPPKHPQATTALILGILGIVACGFAAPFAWWIGNKATKEIAAEPHRYSGHSEANIGKVLGIVGSVLLLLVVAFGVFVLLFVLLAAGTSGSAFDELDSTLAALTGHVG